MTAYGYATFDPSGVALDIRVLDGAAAPCGPYVRAETCHLGDCPYLRAPRERSAGGSRAHPTRGGLVIVCPHN
jgi:hypothetical protein